MPDEKLPLIAYQIHELDTMHTLTAAPLERAWMTEAPQRFPYRCLPLNIANQNGWFFGCPKTFRVYWYGGVQKHDIEIDYPDRQPHPLISSHFGSGVLTFSLPYLFRTPPGINLWVKGPSNWIKDGIQALEGIVETDWSPATFTMNWKLTRTNQWITFEKGEPICMVVPIPRGLTESFSPSIQRLSANPELKAKYHTWEASRQGFLEGLSKLDPEAVQRGWQKDYFQGNISSEKVDGHQTRLNVKEFEDLK